MPSGQSFAVTDPVGATYDGSTDTGKPGLLPWQLVL
jgi:hypothetical protein